MKKTILFLFINLFLLTQYATANPFAGAEYKLTHIGGNTYEIQFTFYRNCQYVTSPPTAFLSFTNSLDYTSNFDVQITKDSTSGNEITPICNSYSSICSGGSGSNIAVEKYTYTQQITIPPGIWTVKYYSCCRNPLTTITNGSNDGFTILFEFNNTTPIQNQTAYFSNPPFILLTKNEDFTYNCGIIDPDNDSLYISFYTPYTAYGDSLDYNSPYTNTNFLSSSIPITIDHQTGEIHLKPNLNLSTVMGIKVEEWRKINNVMTKIATNYRENEIQVYSNTNHYPKLSGFNFQDNHYSTNDTIYSSEIYANKKIEFNICGFDPDNSTSQDGIFNISWNHAIDADTFITYHNVTDSAYAHFEWTPELEDISTKKQYFTVSIGDSACPYNAKQIFTYALKVHPPQLNLGNDTMVCLYNSLVLDADSGDYNYLWSTGDTTQSILLNQSNLIPGNQNISVIRSGYGYIDYDTIQVHASTCASTDISSQNISFKVFPNPNKGVFSIELKKIDIVDVNVSITNSEGKEVYSRKFQNHNGERFNIDISNLSKGIYIITLKSKEARLTKSIIIE